MKKYTMFLYKNKDLAFGNNFDSLEEIKKELYYIIIEKKPNLENSGFLKMLLSRKNLKDLVFDLECLNNKTGLKIEIIKNK